MWRYSSSAFSRSWTSLINVFKLTYMRFMISWFAIVPIALKIIEDAPNRIVFLIGENRITLNLALPFRWWLLWLASFLYLVGLVVYTLWCPKFIRKYPNYNEYKKAKHSQRFILWELHQSLPEMDEKRFFFDWLERRGLATKHDTYCGVGLQEPFPEGKRTIYAPLCGGHYYRMEMSNESADAEKEEEFYWAIHERLSPSKTKRRVFLSVIAILCVMLIGFAISESIFYVFTYLWNEARLSWPIDLYGEGAT